ncbi:ATP-dependent DNA helicase RecG [Ruminococcaceae bacterium YRB3002]|nr:ATP-dependent DNA helicase RecG [Ruminococcaceae bacterium YRB3002]
MAKVTLSSNVSDLYGIGPKKAEKLEALDIRTVYDLLYDLPRRYEDWRITKHFTMCEDGEECSFEAVVSTAPQMNPRSRTRNISFMLDDGLGRIRVTFFNSPYIAGKFAKGDNVFVHGRIQFYNGRPTLVNPYIEHRDRVDRESLIKPVYHQTAGLFSRDLSKWIRTALDLVGDQIPDVIPDVLSRAHDLPGPGEALRMVHFPESPEKAERGRIRIAYEELILLGVGMSMQKEGRDTLKAPVVVPQKIGNDAGAKWRHILNNLGFILTDDQKQAVSEIQKDLMSDVPMNRLVQGDVGSGKTAVAILAMAMCSLMGHQAVLLAPTSVLAKQHYDTAVSLLGGSGIDVSLLLGKTKASEKKEIKARIKDGSAGVVIGTHALLTDDVAFRDLALVIADEQHRFGVRQREKLLLASDDRTVHNLVMTATPIPRTLAMVIYSDMQTSIIRQKPAGRKPVKTSFVHSKDDDVIFAAIETKLSYGEQVYVVCAKVDEEEDEIFDDNYVNSDVGFANVTSVKEMKKILDARGITSRYSCEVMYGALPEKKKLGIMERFSEGEIKILISTTVIEVGVDNPNANLIVIMDADRFGLSTLHQLRGRVGRSDKNAYCILVSESKSEQALSRMALMCQSSDGFELAEADLKLRGPGDFYGTRQHGIPSLRAANLYTDLPLVKEALECVNDVLSGSDSEERERIGNAVKVLFELRFGSRMGGL